MYNILRYIVVLLIGGLLLGWWITRPRPLDPAIYAELTGDVARGEQVFWAAGCASCHAAPKAEGDDRLVLTGGLAFETEFGTFHAPNISQSKSAGIGDWRLIDLANAMQRGVTPGGSHLYPAFPYTTYTRATPQDVSDLFAYLKTLPADDTASLPNDVAFPFNIRRALGAWQWLFLKPEWVVPVEGETLTRGRYLVEALGHCGECHTPRNALGGLDTSRWLQGAANPDGKGRIPPITPDKLTWSETDIASYLATGFTPDYDSAGGQMADVVQNLSHLPESDLKAIAAYLKAVPPGTPTTIEE
ncbi:cytochrome c [Rhodalgimonas zhirmunskyi]|uniref:Cytochrome c n=1 Tax=Rhodalgimonas zhirmunskyi TaxID=2964767 RepID=A0AAJ1U721_9RHOB|nr:cytochrome c [Rhodoalgimonas zhirmunskyi]MDQ2092835.1 cytochrome c [Rhodoalgimonas zhirmunskyi]